MKALTFTLFKKSLFTVKSSLALFVMLVALTTAITTLAYDQPWNGNREDITGPCTTNCAPPPPPCPSGNCKCPPNGTGSPVYLADGSLVWSDTDITFPTNTRVGLKRTYNSFDYRAGLFGRGWVTAQEVNIARTYRAVTEGNADGSPKTATEFESVPIWLASYGRRYELQETASECTTPEVLYFTFEKQTDGTFRQVFEDSQSFSIYSEDGILLQEYSDEDGTTVYYEYDDQNRLVRQFDSYGFTLNFTYNDQGFVSQVTDQAGRVWRYTYNEFGLLVQVLNPDDNTKDYTYQTIDNIGFQEHLLTDVNDNTDDPALTVTWSNIAIGTTSRMRVTSYTESDGHRHDYTYTATTFNGQPAVRVVKDTKQVNSNSTIERQTFTADLDTYQIVQDINNTDNITQNSTYDERGNLLTETDKRGNLTRYEYNDMGQVIRNTELADSTNEKVTTYSYFNDTDRVAVMNEYGILETRYTYDSDLRVLTETQVDLSNNQQRVTTYTYHPNATDSQGNIVLGKVASIDGPQPGAQDTTTYEYNALGLVTRINKPLNQSVSYTYNSVGQQATETDINGVVTEMTHDSHNRLVRTTRNSRTSQFIYNSLGQLVQLVDELGRVTAFLYDDYNQPLRITYPSGDYVDVSYTYNSAYTEITRNYYQADATLISTNIDRHDPETKLPEQKYLANVSQQVSQSQYNSLDELTQKILYGQFNTGTTATTNYSYDQEGRLSQIQDDLSGNTNFQYDVFNRLVQTVDPNGGVTSYNYNAWGDLINLTSPDTGSSTFQIDESGNTISHVNSNSQQTLYAYDLLDRVTQIDYQGSDLDVVFTYDERQFGNGQLTSVIDGSGSTQYDYDDRGLLIQTNFNISGLPLSVSYSYNDATEITQISYPSGAVVDAVYDASGRLSQIQLTENGATTNIIDNVTWHGFYLNSYEQGNGLVNDFFYDNSGRLIEKRFGDSENRLQNQLDNQNQVIEQTWVRNNVQETDEYSHDTLGRLIRDGSATDGVDWLFGYDSVGNRLSQQKSDGTQASSYIYLAGSNLLTQVGSQNITYDNAGNILDDGIRQYQYNSTNRLLQMTNLQTGVQATYSYNFQGQRVRKQLSAGEVSDIRYVYGLNGELLGEYDSSGNRIREYIYHQETVAVNVSGSATSEDDEQDSVVNSLVAVIDSQGAIHYVNTDHLETPRQVTDQNQTVIWLWNSEGFGAVNAQEDPDLDGSMFTLNHRFAGQYFDAESGLHYNFFRYYDPGKGRYITSDPIGLGGGLNTFAYSGSNPINDFDQEGLVCGTGLCVAVVVVVGRIAITGYKIYRNAKKARKALIKVCQKTYRGYKAACAAASGCKTSSRCNNTFKAKLAAAQACYSGRSIYVSIGCDRVIKTTKNHPGQAAQAKRAWQNCQTHAKKICKCKK